MTSPDYSVLLLAWDDADPGVAVLGGTALPPTLPLVYELAAQHPVVALYPHLPAETPAAAPAPTATSAPPAFLPDPLDTDADAPGVRLLPPPVLAAAPAPGRFTSAGLPTSTALAASSRLLGLDDLLPPTQAPLASSHRQPAQFGSVPPPRGAAVFPAAAAGPGAAGRSQWPTPPGPPARWQAPAAPYVGAGSTEARVAPATASAIAGQAPAASSAAAAYSQPGAGKATAPASASSAPSAAPRHPDSQLLPPPPPCPPPQQAAPEPASAFEEPVAEMGSAEASDLDASEDDLTPEEDFTAGSGHRTPGSGSAPGAGGVTAAASDAVAITATAAATGAALTAPVASAPPAAPAYVPRLPRTDGLNYRMIQYARQAMQLVAGHGDFGVIYAPAWPAWLAALEIRNRTGRPLVLYAAALPSDTARPAERGWLLHVERLALRRAQLVLVPDAAMLLLLRTRHGADLSAVRVVPAGDELALQLVLAEVAGG